MVTAVCFLTVLPPAGSCAITWPAGASESRLSKFGINPASRIWVSAPSCSRPMTEGTSASLGPLETSSVMRFPRSSSFPAAGTVAMASPFFTVFDR